MNQEQPIEPYDIVRNGVGLFDLSHMTKLYISGDHCCSFLNRLVSGNMDALREGKAMSTLLMRENGNVFCVVWILKDASAFIILTDAEKRHALLQWLNQYSEGYCVTIEDKTDTLGCVSVIGPQAQEIMRAIAGDDIIGLPYLGFEYNAITQCLICRVGYTGEYEYRLLLPREESAPLMNKIMECGLSLNIAHCDPRVIDTLMLEMRSLNQNKDILEDATPIQVGLHWMIDFRKNDFIGKTIIMQEKKAPRRKLLTLIVQDGAEIINGARLYIDDTAVGFVVNHVFSPTIRKEVGLAYVEERVAWVGINFDVETVSSDRRQATTVSSPLFITKTITGGLQ